jgi:hypothetical protein
MASCAVLAADEWLATIEDWAANPAHPADLNAKWATTLKKAAAPTQLLSPGQMLKVGAGYLCKLVSQSKFANYQLCSHRGSHPPKSLKADDELLHVGPAGDGLADFPANATYLTVTGKPARSADTSGRLQNHSSPFLGQLAARLLVAQPPAKVGTGGALRQNAASGFSTFQAAPGVVVGT